MKATCHHLHHQNLNYASSVGPNKKGEIVGLEEKSQASREVASMMMF